MNGATDTIFWRRLNWGCTGPHCSLPFPNMFEFRKRTCQILWCLNLKTFLQFESQSAWQLGMLTPQRVCAYKFRIPNTHWTKRRNYWRNHATVLITACWKMKRGLYRGNVGYIEGSCQSYIFTSPYSFFYFQIKTSGLLLCKFVCVGALVSAHYFNCTPIKVSKRLLKRATGRETRVCERRCTWVHLCERKLVKKKESEREKEKRRGREGGREKEIKRERDRERE